MRRLKKLLLCLSVLGLGAPVAAQTEPAREDVELSALSSLSQEKKTQVLVVATSHLAAIDGVTPRHVARLLDVLANWKPDVIALERLPAQEIEAMRQSPEYADVLAAFVGSTLDMAVEAQRETGLDGRSAAAAVAGFKGGPGDIDPQEKARRVVTALAAYEPETAAIYWHGLTDEERRGPNLGLSGETIEGLEVLQQSRNERVLVGLALAKRLDLPSLRSIDSHLEAPLLAKAAPDLIAGFNAWGGMAQLLAGPPYDEEKRLRDAGVVTGDLMPLFEYQNGRTFGELDVKAQMDIFNRVDFPGEAGRIRQSLWDERNLRIAAHVRRATLAAPGGKVLVLIGAAHKPWLDQLLGVGLDIRVVQFDDIAAEYTEADTDESRAH